MKLERWSGLLGVGVIVAGQLIAALAYRGRLGEAYSPFNHFVSELGERGVSQAAWAFNGGLLLGGPLLCVFMLALARRMRLLPGLAFGALGLACGLSGTLVGATPMDDLLPHIAWARRFFNTGFAAMLFFTLVALVGRWGIARRLAAPGLIATAAFAAFLAIPQPLGELGGDILASVGARLAAPRPLLWMPAVFEWLAVLAVLGWVLAVVLIGPASRRRATPTASPQ